MKRTDYKTKSRQAILYYLQEYKKSTEKYITAREIVEHFNENNQNISTATVYRVLEKFEKEGIIKKFELEGENSACFEYVGDIALCSHHYHLKCDECGKIIHFHCDEMSDVTNHLNKHHGFFIDTSKTIFYGKCEKCNGNKRL